MKIADEYNSDGFVSNIPLLSSADAGEHRYGYYKQDEVISDTITPANISALIAYREKFKDTYKL